MVNSQCRSSGTGFTECGGSIIILVHSKYSKFSIINAWRDNDAIITIITDIITTLLMILLLLFIPI